MNCSHSARPAVFHCRYGIDLLASLLFHSVLALVSVSRICVAVLTMARLEMALSGPRAFCCARWIDSRNSCELYWEAIGRGSSEEVCWGPATCR